MHATWSSVPRKCGVPANPAATSDAKDGMRGASSVPPTRILPSRYANACASAPSDSGMTCWGLNPMGVYMRNDGSGGARCLLPALDYRRSGGGLGSRRGTRGGPAGTPQRKKRSSLPITVSSTKREPL